MYVLSIANPIMTNKSANKQAHKIRQTYRQTDRHTGRHTCRQTGGGQPQANPNHTTETFTNNDEPTDGG